MADGQTTKEALGRALQELTAQKGFDKVSVSDITGACNLGRQSFYYHFQDKFQLLEWVFYQGAFSHMAVGLSLQNWPERMTRMLEQMEQERRFYVNAVKAQPEFFSGCMSALMEPMFYRLEGYVCPGSELDEERRRFGAQFYALGCAAVITRWAQNGMRMSAAALSNHMYHLAKDSEYAARKLGSDQRGR